MTIVNALYAAALGFYGLGTVCLCMNFLARLPRMRLAGVVLSVCGFFASTLLLALRTSHQSLENFEKGYALLLLSCCLLGMTFLVLWRFRMPVLLLFAVPAAFVLNLFSIHVGEASNQLPAFLGRPFFLLHIGALFASLAFMTVGFGAGLLFLPLQETIKKKRPLSTFQRDLPALAALDRLNALSIVAGFPLFLAGILSGFIWATFTWGQALSGDPKEIFSLVILLLYAFLFHQRLALGWQGRKPALLAILVFFLSVASLCANTLWPTHHSFLEAI